MNRDEGEQYDSAENAEKIKGARKKRSAQRKAEAARTREVFNAEAFKVGETYYIPQHIAFSSPEIAELIRSNPAVDIQIIKSSSIGKSDGGY